MKKLSYHPIYVIEVKNGAKKPWIPTDFNWDKGAAGRMAENVAEYYHRKLESVRVMEYRRVEPNE